MLIFVWTLSQLLRLDSVHQRYYLYFISHYRLARSPKLLLVSCFAPTHKKKNVPEICFGHSHPLGSYHHRSNAWGNDLELWTRSSLAARFNMTLWGNFSTNPGKRRDALCVNTPQKVPQTNILKLPENITQVWNITQRNRFRNKKYNLRIPFQTLGFFLVSVYCYCIFHIALIFSWTVECRLKRNQQAFFLMDEDHFHFLVPCMIWRELRSVCVKS